MIEIDEVKEKFRTGTLISRDAWAIKGLGSTGTELYRGSDAFCTERWGFRHRRFKHFANDVGFSSQASDYLEVIDRGTLSSMLMPSKLTVTA